MNKGNGKGIHTSNYHVSSIVSNNTFKYLDIGLQMKYGADVNHNIFIGNDYGVKGIYDGGNSWNSGSFTLTFNEWRENDIAIYNGNLAHISSSQMILNYNLVRNNRVAFQINNDKA